MADFTLEELDRLDHYWECAEQDGCAPYGMLNAFPRLIAMAKRTASAERERDEAREALTTAQRRIADLEAANRELTEHYIRDADRINQLADVTRPV